MQTLNYIIFIIGISLLIYIAININKNKTTSNFEKFVRDEIDSTKKHVSESFKEQNKSVNEQLEKVIEKSAKLETHTQHLFSFKDDIIKLQNILGDKKKRGVYGEGVLHQILSTVCGNKEELFKMQYSLDDSKIVDAVMFAPNDVVLPIDSKFPLENYLKTTREEANSISIRDFKIDLKNRINETAKYIIDGKTTPYAIMFIPAESIYNEIYSTQYSIVEFAQANKVLLASPATLIAIIYNTMFSLSLIKQNQQAKELRKDLSVLAKDFERFGSRWSQLDKKISEIIKKKEEFNISTSKLLDKFEEINKG